ncbi:helix-turn-helix domain-containing protein [Pimelobacter sp. 30-1]|uniref:helix-turn-helix domain-containing protein n=1 Tax=Pimelobacter sp. 30-1 TaxID=2004991 RepID=UPI001C044558|nr:helix-turn-helix transcriptional regulator [Pimelobacter sp. 30-1]
MLRPSSPTPAHHAPPVLLTHYQRRAAQPIGAVKAGIVRDVLARHAQVGEHHQVLWSRMLVVLEQRGSDGRSLALCAVLANFVALVVFDDPDDLAAAARLGERLDPDRVGRLQQRVSRMLDVRADLPLTTAVARRLLAPLLEQRDPSAEVPEGVAADCVELGRELLFQTIDVVPSTVAVDEVIPVDSADELVRLLDHGSVVEWRRHLQRLATSPWGPYAESIAELAAVAGRPAIGTVLAWCRAWGHEREREQIARHVQHLVAVSGASQRQFAARIGTSPSRLSSYIRGSVTPSAALFLRIQRASRALEAMTGAEPESSSRGA